MNDLVFCSLKQNTQRYSRWALLILPLLLAGCFDAQPKTKRSAEETGISAISRFFAFHQEASSEKSSEAGASAESKAASGGISDSGDLLQWGAESGIAVPSVIESSRNPSKNINETGNNPFSGPGSYVRRRNSSLGNPTATLLNTSFNQLFSSVFGLNRKGEAALFDKEEPPNPFTEARQKQESAVDSSEPKADTTSTKSQPRKDAPAEDVSKSEPSNPPANGSGAPAGNRFLIVGDFNGSGILDAVYAERSSATKFVLDVGELDFNLYINPAAVEQQRSFYSDDIDADGISDLLVTSRSSLFGGVLLGDNKGDYHLIDMFLTGYEAMVPSAGPLFGNKREILTSNMRTGSLMVFRPTDRYRPYQSQQLSFVPSYLLHMVAPGTSLEYLMAAQVGGPEKIFQWSDAALLESVPGGLGEDPSILSGDFGSYSMQAYQVGSYASVVLTSGGSSFNVANMRVNPKIFLVIGDLEDEGTSDVAIGNLMQFTPKSSN